MSLFRNVHKSCKYLTNCTRTFVKGCPLTNQWRANDLQSLQPASPSLLSKVICVDNRHHVRWISSSQDTKENLEKNGFSRDDDDRKDLSTLEESSIQEKSNSINQVEQHRQYVTKKIDEDDGDESNEGDGFESLEVGRHYKRDSAGSHGGGDVLPGDWSCPKCNYNNFAFRTRCVRCQYQKDKDGYGSDGHPEEFSSGRRVAFAVRPGDWSCQKCQFSNFSFRNVCFNCKSPRDKDVYRSDGHPEEFSSRNHGSSDKRPGDWSCQRCQFNNFSSRNVCYSCNTPRGKDVYKSDGHPEEFSSGSHGSSDKRPGDWSCRRCQFNNFSYRNVCFSCNMPREGDGVGSLEVDGNFEGGDVRPEDWSCPKCNYNNFSFRNLCFKCQYPKEGDGQSGGGMDGSEGDGQSGGGMDGSSSNKHPGDLKLQELPVQ